MAARLGRSLVTVPGALRSRVHPGGGMLRTTAAVGGVVVGTWRLREGRAPRRARPRAPRGAAGGGGPVVAPWTDPGPHRVDGLVLSLWDLAPTRPGQATGAELGAALAALHAATAGFPGALPHLSPANEQIADAVDACERDGVLPAAVITVLRDRHRRVLADLAGAGSAPVVLHGDAHGANLLRVPGGWCWTDLEETCAGPPEWDLAVMSGADDGPAALAAYAAAAGTRVPTEGGLGPFRRARYMEGTGWLVAMAHLYPGRYRAVAAERLAALLAG